MEILISLKKTTNCKEGHLQLQNALIEQHCCPVGFDWKTTLDSINVVGINVGHTNCVLRLEMWAEVPWVCLETSESRPTTSVLVQAQSSKRMKVPHINFLKKTISVADTNANRDLAWVEKYYGPHQ